MDSPFAVVDLGAVKPRMLRRFGALMEAAAP
jgi:hypothetical protein